MIRRMVRKAKRFVKRIIHLDNYRNIEKYHRWIREVETTIWHQGELQYTPLVSVVIPVYNVSDGMLRDCINSVLAQTYDKYELILVDDHSTWQNVRCTLRQKHGDDIDAACGQLRSKYQKEKEKQHE